MACFNQFFFDAVIYLPSGLKAKENDFIVLKEISPEMVQLIIEKPLKLRDEGIYKCEASNGSFSKVIEQEVKFVTESFIKFAVTNLTVKVEKTKKATFVIAYEAFPSPEFTLYSGNSQKTIDKVLKGEANGIFSLTNNKREVKREKLAAILSENVVTVTVDEVESSQDFLLVARNPGNVEIALLSLHVPGMFEKCVRYF